MAKLLFSRRQALILGFGSLANIALASCDGSKKSPSGSTVYKIATDVDYAPFEYVGDDGSYVGIDIDLLAAIASDQGFEYELVPLRFDKALQAVKASQADAIIAGMSINEERRESFDFSQPYYDSTVCAAAKAGGAVKSLEDLRGKTVAVKTGTTSESWANSLLGEYGFLTSPFDLSDVMFQDVEIGNTACCFEDTTVVSHAISSGSYKLEIIAEADEDSIYATPYGFAVAKDMNPELLEMFDEGLAHLKEDGTYDTIISKYIKSST